MSLEINSYCYDCLDRLTGRMRGRVNIAMFCEPCWDKREEEKMINELQVHGDGRK